MQKLEARKTVVDNLYSHKKSIAKSVWGTKSVFGKFFALSIDINSKNIKKFRDYKRRLLVFGFELL